MKINNIIVEDNLEEVDRRGFLKGLGAAAVAGAAGGAKADRSWSKDEFSQQFVGVMTSETFPGAVLGWKDEGKDFHLNLREPTNYSPNNVRDKRLYYPKITSPKFQIKFGDDQPISSTGSIYTFPLRQLGDYTGYGMTLARGATFDKWRDSFVNADKVVMRLEIDGQPTTVVFYDNPGLIQQRQSQKKQPVLDKIYQEEKAGGRISGFHGIYSAVELRSLLEPYKDQIPEKFKALDQEINTLVSNSQGHQMAKDIEEQIKTENFLKNTKEYKQAFTVEVINDRLRSVYPESMSRLKKYNSMLSQVNESVNQGVAEGEVTKTSTGIVHKATDKYGAGEEPFNPHNPGKYVRDLEHVDKQQVKDLDASMGITWKNRGTKGVEVDEGNRKSEPPEADYGDDYQDMVSRVKKLAGMGPLKTVYDPAKRVYKNVPTAVQPKKEQR